MTEQAKETWPQTEDRLVREIAGGAKTVREGIQEARRKTIQEVREKEPASKYVPSFDWDSCFAKMVDGTKVELSPKDIQTDSEQGDEVEWKIGKPR